LISIDTLRADRLPAWGYDGVATPAIDALAAESVLFENAYSQVPLTFPSHASLLSGLLPPQAGVRSNVGYLFDAAGHPTLPGVLRTQGYRAGAAVSAYVLRRETGLARDFDAYDDAVQVEESVTLGALQRPGDEAARAALAWLDSQAKGVPFFLFLHLFEPHTPYEPPEPFRSRYRDSYLGEIAAADAIVGRFLDGLRQRGRYDEALIVLLSDHGEGLGDHGEKEHGVLLYRETLHVPLIVKLPGGRRAGTRVAAPAGLVDVFPTVCASLNVACPPGLPGRSLLEGAAEEAAERQIYSETLYGRIHLGWSELRSLVDARYHYISGPDPELYDIAADPGETRNLRDEARRELRARQAGLAAIPLQLEAPAAVDPEEASRLAALGYLGNVAAAPTGPLRDPKQHVRNLERVGRAHELTQSGRLNEAVELCREILREYPELVDVHTQLAATLRRLGRHAEALAAYREAVRLAPPLLDTMAVEIGKLELDLGRLEQAELNARQALAAYPLEAHLLLAGVELARRDLAAAEREARQAVGEASNPRLAALVFLARVLVEQHRLPEALQAVDDAAARIGSGGARPLPTLEATRGDVLARLGRPAEAEAAFRREIELFPRTTEAYVRLAILLAEQRRFDEIEPTLETMVRAAPAPQSFQLAAKTLEDLGNVRAAASFRRRARQSASDPGASRGGDG
jgi:arylsulfatase A-like enzyme/predicted negative regulator of RcsB-dependent stress response